MLVKAVIFDYDGVINDSFREGLRRIKVLCAIHDVRYTLAERRHLQELWGMRGVDLLRVGLGVTAELAAIMYADWEKMDLCDPVKHIPGAREVLFWLRQNGFVSVLLTSRNRVNLTAILDRTDMLREFAFLSSGDDHYYPKPDARAFRFALETLREQHGIEKEHVVFVGDTPADIQGGANALLRTVVVQTGPYMLEHTERYPMHLCDIVPSIDEFPAWLEKHHEQNISVNYY